MGDKDCFGKLWEANAPECCGGREFASGRAFPRCYVYEQCSREFRMRQAATKLHQTQTAPAPPIHLSRPTIPGNGQMQRPTPSFVPMYPQAYQTPPAPRQYAQPYQPHQPQPQPQQQFYPGVYHPIQNLLPFEAPQYLTVLEPEGDGRTMWSRIMAESVRAAMKGVFSHGSFVVDHMPFYYDPSQEPQQEQEKK